ARGRPRALLLQSFLQAGVMVRPGAHVLSRGELGALAQRRNGGQRALAYVYADNLLLALWRGIRDFHLQGDEQSETLSAPVKPPFARPNRRTRLQQSNVVSRATIGHNQASKSSQAPDPLAVFERIITTIPGGQRGGAVGGRLIQPP